MSLDKEAQGADVSGKEQNSSTPDGEERIATLKFQEEGHSEPKSLRAGPASKHNGGILPGDSQSGYNQRQEGKVPNEILHSAYFVEGQK